MATKVTPQYQVDTNINLDHYRVGVHENAWRNRPDGTYSTGSMGTRADSIEAAWANAKRVWDGEWGRQYVEMTVQITQGCHRCYGEGMITKRTTRTVKRVTCPDCMGHGLTRTVGEATFKRNASETIAS